MPNRTLKETICTSDTIDLLTSDEERFFYRLLVRCDDYGRFDARPRVIRSVCFPLKLDEVSDEMVAAWLNRLAEIGLLSIYHHEGRPYLQMATWVKHQQIRAKNSKFPAPDGWMQTPASICNQVQSGDSNGLHMSPSSSSSTNTKMMTTAPVDNSPRETEGNGSSVSPWDEMMTTFGERGIDLDFDETCAIEKAIATGSLDPALVKVAAEKTRGKHDPTAYFRTVFRDKTGVELSELARRTTA